MEDQELIVHARKIAEALTRQKAELEDELETVTAKLRDISRKLGAIDVLMEGTSKIISGDVPKNELSTTLPDLPAAEDKDDMTDFVRDLTRGADTYGIRPRDVTKALTESGKNMSAQYASNALYRLKKRGEVVEYQGRYYWPGFEPPQARTVRPEDVFPLTSDTPVQESAKKEWDF